MKTKEAKNITVVTRAYIVRGRKFTIVRYEVGERIHYGAIEDTYITNGKLNSRLSGAQLKQSDSIDEVLQRVTDDVEIDWLEQQGMDKAEAFATVMGMTDKLDDIRKLFTILQ